METKSKSPILTTLATPAFWLAIIINIVANMAGSCLGQPVNLEANNLGMSATLIGFVASCYTICALLIRTPFGTVLDTSRKPTMVLFISNIFTALVYLGFAVCNSVPFYIVLRLLHGFTFGMRNMAMSVVLAKGVDKKAFGTAMGLLTLIPKIFSSITTKITLWITGTAGIEYVAYAGAALAVLAGVLCLFLKMDNSGSQGSGKAGGKKHVFYFRALPVIVIFAILQIPSLASNNFIVLYGADANLADAAATYASNQNLWMGIAGFICGYLVDKLDIKGAKWVSTVVLAIAAGAGIMVGLSQNTNIWLISGILCGIGAGGSGIFRTVTLRESSASVRALAVGSFAMAQDLVSIFSSTVIGVLADRIGYSMTFVFLGALPIIGIVLTLFGFEKFIGMLQDKNAPAAETQNE